MADRGRGNTSPRASNLTSGRDLEIDTAEISAIDTNIDIASGPSTMRSAFEVEIINAIERTDGMCFDVAPPVASSSATVNCTKSRQSSVNYGASSNKSTSLNKAMLMSTADTTSPDSEQGHHVRYRDGDDGDKAVQPRPKVVLVSFKVNHVTDIDVMQCNFNVSCSLFFHWEDETLIKQNLPLGKISKDKLGPDSDPDIIVINNLTLEQSVDELELVNSSTGAVKLTRQIKGKVFLLSLNLQLFPFDCQNLSINLRSRKQDIGECVLVYFSEESTVDAQPQHEWAFHGYSALTYTTLPQYSSVGRVYSSLHLVVLAQRHCGWFLRNIFLSFFALTMVSWTAYALPFADAHPGQYNITFITLLASICYKYVVCDKLPKVPYRTVADYYIDMSFFCQLFGILSAILRDWVVDDSSPKGGWFSIYPNLNRVLFGVNIGLYLLFHVWMFFKLRSHAIDVRAWRSKALQLNNAYGNIDDESADGASGGAQSQDSGAALSLLSTHLDFASHHKKYNALGFFAGSKIKKLESWNTGDDAQIVFSEAEEEELINIAQSGKASPSPSSIGKVAVDMNRATQPSYINKLNAFQRTLALRAALGVKLRKYGLSSEYCRPSVSKLLKSAQSRPYSLSIPRGVGAPNNEESKSGSQSPFGRDQNIYDDESIIHHIQSRVPSSVDIVGSAAGGVGIVSGVAPNVRSSFSSGRSNKKNPTLDFAADGYVMTSDGY
jgi:hypothetical protein